MKLKNVILCALTFVFIGLTRINAQIVKDADGNVYPSVTIGKQVWMSENLKTTKFNDGTPIPLVTDANKWKELSTPAFCYLHNDISNKDLYGALYNWYTVNSNMLCPKGWHIPSDTEWADLTTFLGDPSTAGDKLKIPGNDYWKNSINEATNEFDFTALPGGMRLDYGDWPEFDNAYAVWWSSTGSTEISARNRGLYFSSSRIFRGLENKRSGFSVRCLKD